MDINNEEKVVVENEPGTEESVTDIAKNSFKRMGVNIASGFKSTFGNLSLKKAKAELEELDARESFIEEEVETPPEPEYTPTGEIIREGRFSKDKHLKKKADKIRGINFITLPIFLKRDCEVDFPFWKMLIHYLIAFLVIFVIGLVYKLDAVPIVMLCATYFLFGPSLVYFHYRKKHEARMFALCTRYIEQMLYSFTNKSKIVVALEECRLVIDGNLGKAIDFAINKIRTGSAQDGVGLYTLALKEIEAVLPCARVKNLHEFLIEVENNGGRHQSALDIMLADVQKWDVRTNEFQQDQAVKGTGMLVSILMSLGTCWFMTNILPADMGGDISGYALYQWVTVISLIVMFFIYRVAARKLTRSWISTGTEADLEDIRSDCEKIVAYNETKKGIKPVLAMVRVKNELDKAFPRWVMRFALFASSEPIPVALRNSIESAPPVIKLELERMIAAIDQHPTSIEPYLDFFGYLDVPHIRSMMLMIYSLSGYGDDEIDTHILSIVERNYLLQANAERIQNDESLARFSLFVTLPMILACIIMMIDVAMIVLNMVNSINISFDPSVT